MPTHLGYADSVHDRLFTLLFFSAVAPSYAVFVTTCFYSNLFDILLYCKAHYHINIRD
jgi:hypothetical protein